MLCLSTNNRSAIQVYKIGGCNALSLNEQQVCYSGIQNEAAMLSLSEQQVCNSGIQNGAAKLCLSANNRSAIQVYKMRLRSSVPQRTTDLQFRYTKKRLQCSISTNNMPTIQVYKIRGFSMLCLSTNNRSAIQVYKNETAVLCLSTNNRSAIEVQAE